MHQAKLPANKHDPLDAAVTAEKIQMDSQAIPQGLQSINWRIQLAKEHEQDNDGAEAGCDRLAIGQGLQDLEGNSIGISAGRLDVGG